jgi:bifunctional non-homologous end joining protein LigD
MGLKEYERKRRFDTTPEPPPKVKPRTGKRHRLEFVVQKHRATRLHYDFRLEWDGVLLSWAVPKGPSLDPKVKRLAMHVEDHPIDYAKFEGIIPAGEYGGGTVMVWDRGWYEPDDADVGRMLQKGEIKFTLHGEKLTGSWVLVRTGPRDNRQWLLIKHRDEAASEEDIAETKPRSVVTERLLAEIAFEEGGDVERAASADPVSAIEALIRDPATTKRTAPKRAKKVWHSNRR